MPEIKINITELKKEGSDLIKELVEFLEEKTRIETETTTNEIIIKGEKEAIPKKHLRVLLRKFLHKTELRDYFRVISGKQNTLIVKEKKIAVE